MKIIRITGTQWELISYVQLQIYDIRDDQLYNGITSITPYFFRAKALVVVNSYFPILFFYVTYYF